MGNISDGTVSVVEDTDSPQPVGGVAELPALAGPPGTSAMGSGTYAVLAGLSVKRRGVR